MARNPKKPQWNKSDISSRLILETILNDKQLQQLHAKRVEIYSLATPTVILGKDGKAKMVWIDETNHPLLPMINEMIDHRMELLMDLIKKTQNPLGNVVVDWLMKEYENNKRD